MRSVIDLISHVLETDRSYGKYAGLYLLALFALFLIKDKNESREGWFAGFSLTAAALAVCPVTVWLAVMKIRMSENFWELLWCIPAALTVSFAAAQICMLQKKGAGRLWLAAGCAALILFSGSVLPGSILPEKIPAFSGGNTLRPDPELDRAIETAASQREALGTDVVLLAPDDIMEKARAYDGGIRLLYGKDLWQTGLHTGVADEYSADLRILYEKMQTDYDHPDEVAETAGWLGCNVLILRQQLTEGGAQAERWELVEEIPDYCLIYRLRG